MSKVYQSVWCNATTTRGTASETARSTTTKTKRSAGHKLTVALATVGCAAAMGMPAAHAGYVGYFEATVDGTGGGTDAVATAGGNVAAGASATASGGASTAVGFESQATANAASAIGAKANAAGLWSLAVGTKASVTADYGTALGSQAKALGEGATALGVFSAANAKFSVAIGDSARALGVNSVALGTGSVADQSEDDVARFGERFGTTDELAGETAVGEVSVGSAGAERRITHVAAGVDDTDATNLGQLKVVNDKADALAQSGTQHYFKAKGNNTDADANAAGQQAVAAGANAQAQGTQAAALGYAAHATGDASLAVGTNANAAATDAVAVGAYASAGTQDAAAVDAVAVGAYASAGAQGAAAFGAHALASGDKATALGNLATASGNNSVALGAGSVAVADNIVSVGSAGNERKITNVAAGTKPTDAVNFGQLNAVATQAATAATKLKGAVMYDQSTDGSPNKNSITLGGDAASGGTAIHNVAAGVNATDAVNLGQLNSAISGAVSNIVVNTANPFFSAEGDRDTEGALSSGTHSVASGANAQASGTQSVALGANANASANNATAIGAGAQASADNAVALGQGSMADRSNTVSVGAAGQERQITNVAPGVQGTDAVNVNQLTQSMSGAVGQAVNQANQYTNDQIRSARRDAYGGTAAALAVAGLPQAVLPGRGMVAVAGGTYGGQSAVAIGVSQLSETGKWVYKVQGTTDSRGQFGASFGAGMHW